MFLNTLTLVITLIISVDGALMDKLRICQIEKKWNFKLFFQQLIVNCYNMKNILMKTKNVVYKVKYILLFTNKLSQLNYLRS